MPEYIALRRHDATVRVDGEEIKMRLPDGCTGIMMVFDSEESAKAFWKDDTMCIGIEPIIEEDDCGE